ncbi:peroxiredoxin family protein [Chryseobacterium cucumeris]|uniref:peroxiredoxin family protein n=1 Tax=Chryseobacterium cucumeris TaxID=1813611 RepID=UPI0023F46894|nr:thioredoxin family protein [Chryseobacterium cucumeris]
MNTLKLLIIAGIFISQSLLYSQVISMDFPHFAGKSYEFILFQGDKQEKVIEGKIPDDGKFTLVVPKQYVPYQGMSRWLITNSEDGGGLDMVISGRDFSVSCQESKPNDTNIIYSGNAEVAELRDLYKRQQEIIMRYTSMQQAMKSFDRTDKNFHVFEQESREQEASFKKFQQEIKQNPDYAKMFLSMVNITMGIGTELSDDEKVRGRNIADYIVEEINWDALYTSGHWSTIISSWVDIHTRVLHDDNSFVNEFIKLTDKINDKKLYKDFARITAYYLTQQGRDALISVIAPYVISSGKIDDYEGSLSAYKMGAVGTQAPDLILKEYIGSVDAHNYKLTTLKSNDMADKIYKKTLLIFYESGCGPCENLLQQLPGKYEDIRSKGVRLISVSADKDESVFSNTSKKFLWKENYCDYEGIRGINFKNYGVAGTPTLVLIEPDGKIVAKTASLDDLLKNL